MKYSLTYLDNTTIIVSSSGQVIILGENLKGWKKWASSTFALTLRSEKNNREINIQKNGTQIWWQNDKLHRGGGPAIARLDGTEEWWVDGAHIGEPR